MDAVVAAIARTRGLVVLHYDAGFELVSQITGLEHQWIVPRASAD